MTRRVVTDFKPFDFRADFGAGAEPGDAAVSLSAADLAALLSQARAEGAAAMADSQSPPETDRIDAAAAKLNDALADLVDLAKALESDAQGKPMSEEARRLINLAAARIIDGQGDLFRE